MKFQLDISSLITLARNELWPQEGSVSVYRDREYFFMFSPQGPIGMFVPSHAYSGADIYIWEGVPRLFVRPVVVHEIVEADLRICQNAQGAAHSLARRVDRLIAKELLSENDFIKYELFRSQVEFPSYAPHRSP